MIAQRRRLTPHLGRVKHVGALVDGGGPRRFVCVFVRCELVVFVAFLGGGDPHAWGKTQANTYIRCLHVCAGEQIARFEQEELQETFIYTARGRSGKSSAHMEGRVWVYGET